MFDTLLNMVDTLSSSDFDDASTEIINYIDNCEQFSSILAQIGAIPESIDHDSTQEKLFSKASDAVLARALREIGLKATVLKERGDSADVQAKSLYHGYTLVADAKSFRLSRTAKNQKDFKVSALSGWRKDSDYAVLCSPYFQYPTNKSQIYAQAVDNNVCLFSWEYLLFLIENGIQESVTFNLSSLWNISATYAEYCVVAEKKKCFIPTISNEVLNLSNKEHGDFASFLERCRDNLSHRADDEITFWEEEIEKISSYTKEEAISELIKAKKINEKIAQIRKYILGITT